MLRDRLAADRQLAGKLGGGRAAPAEQPQHAAAARVGQRREGRSDGVAHAASASGSRPAEGSAANPALASIMTSSRSTTEMREPSRSGVTSISTVDGGPSGGAYQ